MQLVAGTCPECSAEFIGTSWRRYCSKLCSYRAYDKAHPERWKARRRPKTNRQQGWWKRLDAFGRRIFTLRANVGSAAVEVDGPYLRHLMEEQCGNCALCGIDILTAWEVDHIVPRANGGTTTAGNLQLLCKRCNKGKWTDDQETYVEHCARVTAHAAMRRTEPR